jgi:hypothetical protein
MHKFSFVLILTFISFTINVKAQISIDFGDPSATGGNYGHVNVIDPSTIGNKKMELINYSDIEGSPFYNQKWSKAFLYFKNGNLAKVNQVKLNMFSNEVDFINSNNVEMVLDAANFKRLILMKQEDTSRISVIFECYPDMVDSTKGESFYRVLNGGSVQLYTLEKSILKTSEYDPLLGKVSKRFYTKKFYALTIAGAFSPLKYLDKNNILALLNSHQTDEAWLNNNHNKLRSEKDVITFFEFLNNGKK